MSCDLDSFWGCWWVYFLLDLLHLHDLGMGLPCEWECCTGNVLFSVCQGDKSVSTADAVSSVIDKCLAGNCLKNCCPPILASIHGCWCSNYYYNFLFFLFNFWDSVSYDPGCLEFTVAKDDLELLFLLPLSASITGMGHCAQFIGSRILVQGFALDKHSINWSTAQLPFL